VRRYKQLTPHQRYLIYAYQETGYNQKQIAQAIGVSASTVCRELHRHSQGHTYDPYLAQAKAIKKRRWSTKSRKFQTLAPLILPKLIADWSPEQISQWLRKTHQQYISHQCIYDNIVLDRLGGGRIYKHLRQSHKKRRKRYGGPKHCWGPIQSRVDISDRPTVVDAKTRIGDWEADTFCGQNHQGTYVTLVERRSRFTLVGKAKSKRAHDVARLMIQLLKPFKAQVHTITSDNGSEFAQHRQIAKALEAQFFFAQPYSPWQRGLCENTIGLLRQYFPKKTALTNKTHKYIKQVMNKLNLRPRKCLDFKTPFHCFTEHLNDDNTIALVF
jgi:IS30 family transposase